jgi:hypothetical protein
MMVKAKALELVGAHYEMALWSRLQRSLQTELHEFLARIREGESQQLSRVYFHSQYNSNEFIS